MPAYDFKIDLLSVVGLLTQVLDEMLNEIKNNNTHVWFMSSAMSLCC